MKSLLLIFVKNPVLGKVKTRLAASIGDEKALATYLKLLEHTKSITENLEMDKRVYYSWEIEENDLWNIGFEKRLQSGEELGEKMQKAFEEGFEDGYDKIVIMGSDCYDLTSEIINEAFESLSKTDVVIGPAMDGGYYLLGMNKLYGALFENKKWSTESVFIDTIEDIMELEISHTNLTTLSDVDNIKDLARLNLEV